VGPDRNTLCCCSTTEVTTVPATSFVGEMVDIMMMVNGEWLMILLTLMVNG
jgi:hypothetical protein